jgi:hypothetical protein
MPIYTTQNSLLMKNLLNFYKEKNNIDKMLSIINGESKISLRIVDWFTTNYAKKYYTVYSILKQYNDFIEERRFKVYVDYKLKLRSYSKKRFDPFCRWDRITIPYKDESFIQTTIGQLNFFKWAFENNVISYIEANYQDIEIDMNARNSTSKRNKDSASSSASSISSISSNASSNSSSSQKTRKKREELSISASKTIKKEDVDIIVCFS